MEKKIQIWREQAILRDVYQSKHHRYIISYDLGPPTSCDALGTVCRGDVRFYFVYCYKYFQLFHDEL